MPSIVEHCKTTTNGAEILERFRLSNGWFVLCWWEVKSEFVTWWCDDDGNCEHGNYFKDYDLADADFKRRCRETILPRLSS